MAKDKEEKQLTMEETLKALDKDYGKGAIISGNDVNTDYHGISTGSIGLDKALGIGGIARGKIYEIFGWESSGKSTVSQTIVGNFQKAGIKCLYIDAEGSIDPEYTEALGVKLDDLLVMQMDEHGGEGAYDKMRRLVRTGEIGLVVIDSYNALQPKALVDGEGASGMGKHARMLGEVVMQVNELAIKYGTTFIFLGQLREKIGVMFGNPETTQGGNALKFYAHVRMRVGRSTTKDNSVIVNDLKMGNKTTVSVEKNKLAPPFRKAEFNIIYGEGIDRNQELIDMGKDLEILSLRAGVVTYNDTKYPLDEFKELVNSNPEFYQEIYQKILQSKA